MKRICSLLLAFVMMFSMVACGVNPSTEQNSEEKEVIAEVEVGEEDEEPEIKIYSATFEYNFGNEGVYKTVDVTEGSTVEKPVDPERKGYYFIGWYTEKSGEKFDFDTIISEDISLQAKWEKIALESDATATPVTNVSDPTPGQDTSTPRRDEPAYGHDAPTHVSKVYYTVNFDANGGTSSSSYIKVESGSAIGVLPEASRDGYTFLGWYTESSEGTEIISSTVITSHMTVYAHWLITESGTGNARITFDKNDGSPGVYQVQNVNEGDTVTKPEDPTREMYRFTGWYLEAAAVTEYNFRTPVTGDMTLYAGWGNPDGTDDGLYAASNTTETVFSISDIFVENNEVTVTYNTNNIALVSVEFFEDCMITGGWTEENLNANLSQTPVAVVSGYTEAYGEMATITIPLTSALPEYFLVRAKMSDSGSNSTEYVSSQYTRTFAEFNALTVDDFEEEKVINFDGESDTNFGVIKDSVIVVPIMSQYSNAGEFQVIDLDNPQSISDSDEPQMENLVPDQLFNFPDKNAVISTKEDGSPYTLSDLVAGDVIYVEGTTWMFKIKDIYENTDGSISFTADSETTMLDFYNTLKVDFKGLETEVSDPRLRWEIIDVDGSGSVTLGPFGLEKEFNNGVTLGGSISGKVTGNVTLFYDAHLFSEDYFEASFTFTTELNGQIKAEISTDNNNEYKNVVFQVDTRKVKLPTPVTGLNIYVKPAAQINWNLSGDVSINWNSKQVSGFKYNSDTGRTDIKKKENTVSVMATGNAEAKVGPVIDIGVEVLNGVLSGGVVAEAGAKVSATAEIGADDLLGNADSKHACGLCVSGRADWYATAFAKCSYKITDKLKGDIVKVEILNITAPLTFNAIPGKFFVSVINSTDSPFGGRITLRGGECINKTYRTEFRTQDMNGNDINGNQVAVVRQGLTNGKAGRTPYVVYLYNGTYKAHTEIGGSNVTKTFVVNGNRQTVILNKNSVNTVLEGTVVDANNPNSALSGATIKVRQGDVVVASAETDNTGKFSIPVPSGSLTIEITLDNYLPFSSSETIHEGDATHSMGKVELTPGVGMGGFHGVIRDAVTNEPISDIKLNLYEGWNNPATANTSLRTLKTNSNGEFRYDTVSLFGNIIGLPSGNYTLTASKEGYTDTSYNIVIYPGATDLHPAINETMSPKMVDGDYRIVLTWGNNPRDLDSHLVAETSTGEPIHIFYSNRNPSPYYANLDRDDVDGEGPETITITNFAGLKNIRYAVHDYTNHRYNYSNALSNSGAVVRLYKGNQLLRTFNVPTGYDGTEWDVFSLSPNGRIETLNTMTYSDPNNVLSGVRTFDLQSTYKDYELTDISASESGEENVADTSTTEETAASEETEIDIPVVEE